VDENTGKMIAIVDQACRRAARLPTGREWSLIVDCGKIEELARIRVLLHEAVAKYNGAGDEAKADAIRMALELIGG
jgi:hypothetical protein